MGVHDSRVWRCCPHGLVSWLYVCCCCPQPPLSCAWQLHTGSDKLQKNMAYIITWHGCKRINVVHKASLAQRESRDRKISKTPDPRLKYSALIYTLNMTLSWEAGNCEALTRRGVDQSSTRSIICAKLLVCCWGL